MLWIHTPVPAGEAEELGRRAGVGPVLAELLLRGGHGDPALAARSSCGPTSPAWGTRSCSATSCRR